MISITGKATSPRPIFTWRLRDSLDPTGLSVVLGTDREVLPVVPIRLDAARPLRVDPPRLLLDGGSATVSIEGVDAPVGGFAPVRSPDCQ